MLRRPAADAARQPAPRADAPEDSAGRRLPLEAVVDGRGNGWSVRLPVRAEQITVTKESVLVEDVHVMRRVRKDMETVQARVRSEQLTVDNEPAQH